MCLSLTHKSKSFTYSFAQILSSLAHIPTISRTITFVANIHSFTPKDTYLPNPFSFTLSFRLSYSFTIISISHGRQGIPGTIFTRSCAQPLLKSRCELYQQHVMIMIIDSRHPQFLIPSYLQLPSLRHRSQQTLMKADDSVTRIDEIAPKC